MKKAIATIVLLLVVAMLAVAKEPADVKFSKYFTGEALRVDCLREGSARYDTVWVSGYARRGTEWHGSRTQLIDPFDNGDYRVEMRDARSGKVIYAKGYSSLFREYKDTPEGKTISARFEEVLLLPMPRKAVDIVFQKRDSKMQLYDASTARYIPGKTPTADLFAGVAMPINLEIHGSPSKKIDVVIVAQGYDEVDKAQLTVDYFRIREILFGQEPFKKHRTDFNVYGVQGNAGAEYGTFGADRYLMTFNLFQLHNLINATPADYIIIMVNDSVYGGGAIYNFYAVTSLHTMAEYVLPHELGHGIGGLADEYVDEELSYADIHNVPFEPLEPNITNLVDFGRKWQALVPAGTRIPTLPNSTPRNACGPIGVYEGAGYAAKGVYRPTMNCMMRNYAPFCPVCSERMEAIFSLYTK